MYCPLEGSYTACVLLHSGNLLEQEGKVTATLSPCIPPHSLPPYMPPSLHSSLLPTLSPVFSPLLLSISLLNLPPFLPPSSFPTPPFLFLLLLLFVYLSPSVAGLMLRSQKKDPESQGQQVMETERINNDSAILLEEWCYSACDWK